MVASLRRNPGTRRSRAGPRLVWRLGLAIAGILAAAGTGRVLGPRLFPFPEPELLGRRPAQIFTDSQGAVIGTRLGDQGCWRLPVPGTAVSPYLILATVAVEDRRFWEHDGVDWLAVGRAAVADLRQGRIVSGASTISMQLARLAKPESRSWGAKLRQACRAWDLERRHGKGWILEQYLNLAPYGANLVGVEAAARCYFGKSSRDLSLPEATLLAGLPQRPSFLRPDRHPDRAQQRQARVIGCLVRCGWLSPEQAASVRDATPAVLAAIRARARLGARLGLPSTEPEFCRLASREGATDPWVRTTLDPLLQGAVRQALRTQAQALPLPVDGAAVVIENRSGAVRALVGTIAPEGSTGGQVNAACSRRSPGSALKPFIYLLALDGGLIVPDTILADEPLSLADYRPANFDGEFRGWVTARAALADSLNAPAVTLLGQVGVGRLLEQLRQCGIRTLDRGTEAYGLALALGGGEVTLLELTNAYAGLARGGLFRACRFATPADEASARVQASVRPFAAGSVTLVREMLSVRPLPGSPGLNLAWKTGTSTGFRDAWCVAFNSDFTIGVWIGHQGGRPDPDLVGIRVATPVVASIANSLYSGPRLLPPPPAREGVVRVALCAETGLRAMPCCGATRWGDGVAGVPLRGCMPARHRSEPGMIGSTRGPSRAAHSGVRIRSPVPRAYLAEDEAVRLELAAVSAAEYVWYVDGAVVGRSRGPLWHEFPKGRHEVCCLAASSGATDRVTLLVR